MCRFCSAIPASRSARVRRRAPFLGGRLACRAVAPYHVVKMRPYHVVKMRGRSFAPRFNENYPLSRSFSLRVVGVLYPHTPTLLLYPSFLHSFCQGVVPKIFACGGNTPTPLRGYYTLALPCYLFVTRSHTRFVKELRRKISRAKLAKFFAPLTTMSSYNS